MNRRTNLIGTSPASSWATEYSRGGIPSSVRARPSNVVTEFLANVWTRLPTAAAALDIGTGTGRNAIFLAEEGFSVKAMDYSAPQVEALQEFARSRPDLRLEALVADVIQPWPWQDASADVAIDAFCFKHQIGMDGIATYIAELTRCLAPGGLYMLFLATREDGYYRQFAVPDQYGVGQIIVDAGNGISSRLYAREEIEQLFTGFDVLHYAEKNAQNDMHGETYQRSSAVWHMRRR
jgi:SAM-dependent methyltransferase